MNRPPMPLPPHMMGMRGGPPPMPAPTVAPSSQYEMPRVPTWFPATTLPYNALYSISLSAPDNLIIIDWPTIGNNHPDELSKF